MLKYFKKWTKTKVYLILTSLKNNDKIKSIANKETSQNEIYLKKTPTIFESCLGYCRCNLHDKTPIATTYICMPQHRLKQ